MRTRRAWLGGVSGLAIALSALVTGVPSATAAPESPASRAVNPTDTAPDPQPNGGPHTQIVGGEKAFVKDYPFIIAMLREGGARPMGQTCTAAVVAKRVIVTAAHCKDGQGAKSMYYGSDDLTVGGGTKIAVKEYLQHPNYSPPNGWQTGWDVGIVVTETDIPVPAGYKYPRVAASGDSALTAPGKNALLLGYGRVRDGENEFGHLKRVASYPIVNGSNTCGSFGSFNNDYMVCGGYQDGHDGICQGDSGGPMLVDGVVVGVASWVRTGCNSYGAWGRLTGVMGDWANEQIKKFGDPGEPGAPTAAFTANCSTSEPSCTFDASGSSDPNGSISSYAWKFGDNQNGTGATPSHTYGQAGTYTVELTVTDNEGKTDTETKQITAGKQQGQAPRASFTVQCQWDTCNFNGTGSTDPDNDIATYNWAYGDGTTGNGTTSSHKYPNKQATYTAELKVTDKAGHTHSTSKQVQCYSVGSQAFCFGQ
ncbi:PKD domain-containing protein [Kibdelosporangium phytohabitans]|uniref:PKD domain-containing protein n=1 Tax=Kibdelosporangium phytohabitans TaxID=860235 RepID=UPI0009FAF528|nr:PKD domain-containing protein [Kibdelosporangium phytohabitans]MBE1462383.1 PKD repeat protein [Kibdelosporangium phytohabitans]